MRGTQRAIAPDALTRPRSLESIPQRVRAFVNDAAHKSPSRFAVIVFTSIIFLWTALLMLPISSATGEVTPFHQALFTAVSTICVTGLAVVDMAQHWSPFGTVLIFIGFNVGAVGVLTLASMMGAIVTRRLGLRQKLMAASDSNPLRTHAGAVSESQAVRLGDIGGVLATVAISLVVIETSIALLIVPRLLLEDIPWYTAVWEGFYYAASAFTNTGFTPNAGGLAPFTHDIWMLNAIAIAVFAGSLGFPVIFALFRWVRTRQRLPVHAKLTLLTTSILLVVGAIAIYLLESANPATIGAQEPWMRPFTSLFMSSMARSGGFSTIDLGQANPATMLALDMLMFVGGGSASTAGGIKVTTIAILFLAAIAEARGVNDMQAFGRRIPTDVLRLSVSIALWGATIVAASSILLMHFTGAPLTFALFDSISAFATCGLSSGLTQNLPPEGSYILAVTMWLGRVGTVTMAAALASSEHKQLFRLPEERIIVG